MSAFKQYAAKLVDLGFSPIPIIPGQKRPLGQCAFYDHWNELREHALTPQQIDILCRSNPHLGLGVAGGYNCLLPIDFDTTDASIKRACFSVLPRKAPAKQGKKGGTLFFWNSDGMIDGQKFKARKGNGWDMLVEVLATGQSLLPPTPHPDTLLPYKWLTEGTLFNTKVDDLPQITQTHVEDLKLALSPWLPKPEEHALRLNYSASVNTDDKMRVYARAAMNGEAKRLALLSEGRNWGLFVAACKLGRYIHHGCLTEFEVQSALIQATRANGYAKVKHGGEKRAWKTLRSGLRKAIGDTLPDLSTPRPWAPGSPLAPSLRL